MFIEALSVNCCNEGCRFSKSCVAAKDLCQNAAMSMSNSKMNAQERIKKCHGSVTANF
jgi:hypothetical protein